MHFGETVSVFVHILLKTFKKHKHIKGKPCLCVRGFQHIRTKYSKLVCTESFRLNITLVRIAKKVTTNLESRLLYLKHNT